MTPDLDSSDSKIAAALLRASQVSSCLVAGMGLLTLLGWLSGLSFLQQAWPSIVTMKVNTALLFVALGVGLWRARRAGTDRWRTALASFVAGVASLTLAEYAFDTNLGVDQLLLADVADALHPGRMAAATALLFLLLAIALAVIDRTGLRLLVDLAGLVTALVALQSLCGYLYAAPSLYHMGADAPIACHTALGFLAACVALFSARPLENGMKILSSNTSSGALLRWLLPFVIGLPVLLGWLLLKARLAGSFDTRFEVAVLVVANVATIATAVGFVAVGMYRSELERRRSELWIRARERELSITLDSIGDAVIATDAEGRVVRVNPVAEKLTGYCTAEAAGRTLSDVFRIRSELTGASVESPVDRVLRDGSVVGLVTHCELVARDGTARPIAESAAPIRAPGSQLTEGVVLVFRDMQRERAEARDQTFLHDLGEFLGSQSTWRDVMGEVAERLGRFLGAAHASFVDIDEGAQLATVHAGLMAAASPAAGTHPLAALNPGSQADWRAGRTVAIADTAADPRLSPHDLASFAPLNVRALLAVPLLRSGSWRGLLLITRSEERAWDPREVALAQRVAERTWLWVEHLRALDALRVSEARKAAKLNSAFDGIVSIDHTGAIIEFNPAAERLFGRTRTDVLGQQMSDLLVPAQLREAHRQGLARHLATGEGAVLGKTVELPALRSDGSEFPAELAITRVQGQSPAIFTAFIRDVSERKRSEAERLALLGQLRDANAQLEARVAARTADLAETLKEREVLLQEIHHRVKNNLQVISSLINMQRRQVSDVASRTALEECQSRVAAIALIHEKLYQSKDYGRVPFSEYASSLALSIFHTSGTSLNQITLSVEMQTTWLAVDRAIPCGLILNELITNALKHAFPVNRRGGIWVTLERDATQKVIFGVRDDGVGIPPDFDPNISTSLGMQLVAVLVQQLGAQLDIDRSQGTAFRISFSDRAN